ncbi:HAMP domain-containing protein [Rhodobacteraceae bacterium 2CG4]|uniref:histidine kinase n=1 Tax=Halovulum marinum TaxID=2662447 RepID=A0A6L5YXN3_9RHOB|nr:ATP-binding protein [Halovulum marinum]MSU89096.1 HAMP domain-containing protein [Halovulum marinum]
MTPRNLKYPLPRSLFPRAMLIVIVPLIALQLVVAFVFFQRHFEGVTRQMTRNIARELAVAQQVIDTSPTAEIAQLRLTNLSQPLEIALSLRAEELRPGAHRRDLFDLSGRALVAEMADLLGGQLQIDLAADRRQVDVRLQTDKGVLRAVIPRSRMTVSNPHQLLVLMTATALVLAVIALLFMRNQMKPILQLANAADAFGKGRSVPYRPAGAEEVRRAGAAFLSMRQRIERAMEQRTQMLSGVSHDLRTPLTRMKLSLAMADAMPEAREMERDVEQMEQMLNSFLAFARGDQMDEVEDVHLPALLEEMAEQARRGGGCVETDIRLEPAELPTATLRRAALARALQNLLSNATRYGSRTRLSLRTTPRAVQFIVEDDGPGVPVDRREEVMRPFIRLDSARNQDRGGGVGLGLAIAQDVARAHGGALELSDSEALGGLKAVLRLPR